jgi:hypothetical protein
VDLGDWIRYCGDVELTRTTSGGLIKPTLCSVFPAPSAATTIAQGTLTPRHTHATRGGAGSHLSCGCKTRRAQTVEAKVALTRTTHLSALAAVLFSRSYLRGDLFRAVRCDMI